MNTTINKAVVAFISSLVTLVAMFGVDVSFMSDSLIAGIGSVVTAILVWVVPNKKAE